MIFGDAESALARPLLDCGDVVTDHVIVESCRVYGAPECIERTKNWERF